MQTEILLETANLNFQKCRVQPSKLVLDRHSKRYLCIWNLGTPEFIYKFMKDMHSYMKKLYEFMVYMNSYMNSYI